MSLKEFATPLGAISLAALAALGIGVYVWFSYRNSGGAKQLGEDIGSGIADATVGVVSGTVGGLGAAVGLPKPGALIDDPYIAAQMITQNGFFDASKKTTAGAFLKASFNRTRYMETDGE